MLDRGGFSLFYCDSDSTEKLLGDRDAGVLQMQNSIPK